MYRACNATREGGSQWHVASGWEAAIFFVADVCLGAIWLVASTGYVLNSCYTRNFCLTGCVGGRPVSIKSGSR